MLKKLIHLHYHKKIAFFLVIMSLAPCILIDAIDFVADNPITNENYTFNNPNPDEQPLDSSINTLPVDTKYNSESNYTISSSQIVKVQRFVQYADAPHINTIGRQWDGSKWVYYDFMSVDGVDSIVEKSKKSESDAQNSFDDMQKKISSADGDAITASTMTDSMGSGAIYDFGTDSFRFYSAQFSDPNHGFVSNLAEVRSAISKWIGNDVYFPIALPHSSAFGEQGKLDYADPSDQAWDLFEGDRTYFDGTAAPGYTFSDAILNEEAGVLEGSNTKYTYFIGRNDLGLGDKSIIRASDNTYLSKSIPYIINSKNLASSLDVYFPLRKYTYENNRLRLLDHFPEVETPCIGILRGSQSKVQLTGKFAMPPNTDIVYKNGIPVFYVGFNAYHYAHDLVNPTWDTSSEAKSNAKIELTYSFKDGTTITEEVSNPNNAHGRFYNFKVIPSTNALNKITNLDTLTISVRQSGGDASDVAISSFYISFEVMGNLLGKLAITFDTQIPVSLQDLELENGYDYDAIDSQSNGIRAKFKEMLTEFSVNGRVRFPISDTKMAHNEFTKYARFVVPKSCSTYRLVTTSETNNNGYYDLKGYKGGLAGNYPLLIDGDAYPEGSFFDFEWGLKKSDSNSISNPLSSIIDLDRQNRFLLGSERDYVDLDPNTIGWQGGYVSNDWAIQGGNLTFTICFIAQSIDGVKEASGIRVDYLNFKFTFKKGFSSSIKTELISDSENADEFHDIKWNLSGKLSNLFSQIPSDGLRIWNIPKNYQLSSYAFLVEGETFWKTSDLLISFMDASSSPTNIYQTAFIEFNNYLITDISLNFTSENYLEEIHVNSMRNVQIDSQNSILFEKEFSPGNPLSIHQGQSLNMNVKIKNNIQISQSASVYCSYLRQISETELIPQGEAHFTYVSPTIDLYTPYNTFHTESDLFNISYTDICKFNSRGNISVEFSDKEELDGNIYRNGTHAGQFSHVENSTFQVPVFTKDVWWEYQIIVENTTDNEILADYTFFIYIDSSQWLENRIFETITTPSANLGQLYAIDFWYFNNPQYPTQVGHITILGVYSVYNSNIQNPGYEFLTTDVQYHFESSHEGTYSAVILQKDTRIRDAQTLYEKIDLGSGSIGLDTIKIIDPYFKTTPKSYSISSYIPQIIVNFTNSHVSDTLTLKIHEIAVIPYFYDDTDVYVYQNRSIGDISLASAETKDLIISPNYLGCNILPEKGVYRLFVNFSQDGSEPQEIYSEQFLIMDSNPLAFGNVYDNATISDLTGSEILEDVFTKNTLSSAFFCYIVNEDGIGHAVGDNFVIYGNQYSPRVDIISPNAGNVFRTSLINVVAEITDNNDDLDEIKIRLSNGIGGYDSDFIDLDYMNGNYWGETYNPFLLESGSWNLEVIAIDDALNYGYDQIGIYIESYKTIDLSEEEITIGKVNAYTSPSFVKCYTEVNYTSLPALSPHYKFDLGDGYEDARNYKLQRSPIHVYYPYKFLSQGISDVGKTTYWGLPLRSTTDQLNFELTAPIAEWTYDSYASTSTRMVYTVLLRRNTNIRTYNDVSIIGTANPRFSKIKVDVVDITGEENKTITADVNLEFGFVGEYNTFFINFTIPTILKGVDYGYRIVIASVLDEQTLLEEARPINVVLGIMIGAMLGYAVRWLMSMVSEKYRIRKKEAGKKLGLWVVIGGILGAFLGYFYLST